MVGSGEEYVTKMGSPLVAWPTDLQEESLPIWRDEITCELIVLGHRLCTRTSSGIDNLSRTRQGCHSTRHYLDLPLTCVIRFQYLPLYHMMEFQDAQNFLVRSINEITSSFQKVPGSAMLIRYIQSSYQNDPVRSAIELILVIFFVRYLLAPSYSTNRQNFVTLTEEVGIFRFSRVS